MGEKVTYERWDSVDDILGFAMAREKESAEFYAELAGWVEKPSVRKLFEGFAREERGHQAKLRALKEGKRLLPPKEKVQDLRLGDYLVDEEPGKKLDYQDALILAMKKEKASFRLYNDLAATTADENLRATLLSLAQEEAKHKLRLEVEYDEHFLTED